ncbi:glutamyl-tRNA(Gln) amidotransferase, subunit B [Ureaplasma parvum serovar 14 str. ATCC 33697]|uniref:Asp-tRNA(Asn)/Glu-tRNA(Gln) amidotransferase subunit GatB n=1 Tax=Ureaplasma parvum TaxID=134821 RepID=UPI00017250D2|nr:Asp-tRNA(Asn)/Glu-tRNA(Gln) amidotransferase subunit GatB [Ureaplasma parvum]EDT87783.1 glutamyl-tRNA(Gln) amidotransferase, subunit B [Ureaplasma parvum serovar 14 str. ATCC 33697]MDU7891609.1 Asp-tRNA(Asn)/Glu-tRNA(Gln) amidotransferase subunit GatB [Ureaplasma parvum]
MQNFEVIIGIEVHTALNTKTKMFSNTATSHKSIPNTLINEIDLALPGTLPTVNQEVVHKGLFLANALHMRTNHQFIAFDRKHYYYLDLPKGYQITQNYFPIGQNGYIQIIDEYNNLKRIRIKQIHLEEDTAKQTNIGNQIYLDYNRAGWPLIEIVSEADLRSAQETVLFLEELRKILLFNDISDAKMEDGSLRVDVNVSIRPQGAKKFGTKVEIKNINSISNVAKAIDYEIRRQLNLILLNQNVEQQTRRFDDNTNTTVFMRSKNDAINYRYIREANIAPIHLSDDYVKKLFLTKSCSINDLRQQLAQKGLVSSAIEQLLSDGPLFKAFKYVDKIVNNPLSVYKWLCLEFIGLINKNTQNIEEITPELLQKIARMILLFDQTLINGKQTKIILEKIYLTNKDPQILIKELGFEQITNENEITKLWHQILAKNQEMLLQYNERPDRVEKFFMGEIMKLTKAQANPTISFNVLKKILQK